MRGYPPRRAADHRVGDVSITIVTTVLNAEKLIKPTLDSVVSQTHRPVELIVVDGGSTDATLKYLREHDALIDYWISEPDKGIADAMNKGISLATGELILFLNAGDFLVDENVLTFIAQWYLYDRWSWAYGTARLLINFSKTPFSQRYRPFRRWRYFYCTPHCHQATCFRRALFTEVGMYSTEDDRAFDVEFFIRAARSHVPSTTARPLVWYDVTGFSSRNHFQRLVSRLRVTARTCDPKYLMPLWIALILYRALRSLLASGVKRVIAAFYTLKGASS